MALFTPDLSFTAVFSFLQQRLPLAWTRHTTFLGPLQVVTSLVFMNVLGVRGYRSVMSELRRRFNNPFRWGGVDIPTAPAFTQARKKISEEMLRGLFQELVALCLAAKRRPALSYGDLDLVCVDGTNVVLPGGKKLMEHFGAPSNQVGCAGVPQAGLVLLWDPARSLPLDFRITTCKPNERECLLEMLPTLTPRHLLLGDRGFPSRGVFFALAKQRTHFLIRLPRSSFAEVNAFCDSAEMDRRIEFSPTDAHGKVFGEQPLTVRLIKRLGPDGEPQVFATSLIDERMHPREQLYLVYGKRWAIETGLREMKVFHGLERLHARTVEGIKQEIIALMIFFVLCAEVDATARETLADQFTPAPIEQPTAVKALGTPADSHEPIAKLEIYPVRFNRVQIAEYAIYLLGYCLANDREQLNECFHTAIRDIWRYRSKPRPGRSFPRVAKSPNAKQRTVRRTKADNA